jgi:hypothetical protein
MSADTDWQCTYQAADGSVKVECLGGVDWMDAPLPPRFHRCKPQTRGGVNRFTRVYRCACGGVSMDGRYWDEKNDRRSKR